MCPELISEVCGEGSDLKYPLLPLPCPSLACPVQLGWGGSGDQPAALGYYDWPHFIDTETETQRD